MSVDGVVGYGGTNKSDDSCSSLRRRIDVRPRRRVGRVRDMKVDNRFRRILESQNIDTRKLIERDVMDIKKVGEGVCYTCIYCFLLLFYVSTILHW